MLRRLLPHATLIAAMMTLILFVISRFNSAMAFMTAPISQWLFFLLALLALWSALTLIGTDLRRRLKKKYQKRDDR